MSTIEFVKKISAKTLQSVPKDLKVGEKFEAYRVAGIATATKVAITSFGESVGLIGDFRAIGADGKTYGSGVAFLPKECTSPIAAELARQAAEGVQNIGVEFAVAIYATGIEPKTPGSSSYEWTFVPLIQQATENRAATLLAKTIESVPVLKLAPPPAGQQEIPEIAPAEKGKK